MIGIFAWCWGTKYLKHAEIMANALSRTMTAPYRFTVIVDEWRPELLGVNNLYQIAIDALPEAGRVRVLLNYKDGCYARLVMFGRQFAEICRQNGYARLVCVDLDAVVIADLSPVIRRPLPFLITTGIHFLNTRYNGSMIVMDPGVRPRVWENFDLTRAERVAWSENVYQGTDQSWIWHALGPHEPGIGPHDGVYGFGKPGWTTGNALPTNARAVFFPGSRDPSNPALQAACPWIGEHWR